MESGLSARAAPFAVGSGPSTPAPRVASVHCAAAGIERTISTVSMDSFVPPVVHRLPVQALSGISDVPLHFDDGENGMCDGYLLGPDGKPLVRRQGLTDAQIMSGKLASVLGLRVNDDTVSPAYIVDRHKITGYVGTVDRSLTPDDGNVLSACDGGGVTLMLVDSGAGANFLTTDTADTLGLGCNGDSGAPVLFEDIRGVQTTARSVGTLEGTVIDAEGATQTLSLGPAYTHPSIQQNVVSVGEVTEHADASVTFNATPTIELQGGAKVQLQSHGHKTWAIPVTLKRSIKHKKPYFPKAVSGYFAKLRTGRNGLTSTRVSPRTTAAVYSLPVVESTPDTTVGVPVAVPDANVVAATKAAAAAVEAVAAAIEANRRKTERAEQLYRFHHEACNHRTETTDALLAAGMFPGAKKPLDFFCIGCSLGASENQSFSNKWNRQPVPAASLRAFNRVQIDTWGPIDVGDRNLYRFLVGLIDEASGASFVQPVQTKGQAVEVLKSFRAWLLLQAPFIETKFGYPPHSVGRVVEIKCDRGGEFGTTLGARRSAFEEYVHELGWTMRFNEKGEPRSGTAKIEAHWNSLNTATEAAMVLAKEQGCPEFYRIDAMMDANFKHNRMPTSANRFNAGEAPFTSLGLSFEPASKLIPFYSPGSHHIDKDRKSDLSASRSCRIIGTAPADAQGYVIVLDPQPDSINRPPEIKCSVDVTPLGPRKVAEREPRPLAVDARHNTANSLLSPAVDSLVLPVVQTIGTAPGDAGSRAALLPPLSGRVGGHTKSKLSVLFTREQALQLIQTARTQGFRVRFQPENPKSGASGLRYDLYSRATSFGDLEALRHQKVLIGNNQRVPIFQGGLDSLTGDLINDVSRGYATFVEPVYAPEMPLTDESEPITVMTSASSVPSLTTSSSGAAAPRRSLRLAGSATVVSDIITDIEYGMLDIINHWGGPEAGQSERRSGICDLPHQLVTWAVGATDAWTFGPIVSLASMQMVTDEDVHPEHNHDLRIFDVTRHTDGNSRKFPFKPHQWAQEHDYHSAILPALGKELTGTSNKDVWTVVRRESWMKPIESFWLLKEKATVPPIVKARFVLDGSATEEGVHYGETATSMVCQVAVKMVVAWAAGDHLQLYSLDVTQAFLNAPAGRDDLYIELPEHTAEMRANPALYGVGRCSAYVGHLHKSLYGLKDAPRNFQRYFQGILMTVGVTVLSCDRNVFKWTWEDEELRGCVHVDDVLFAGGARVRGEFLRRVSTHIDITSNDEPCTTFCGYSFTYDDHQQTITMHQTPFLLKMLGKYGMLEVKPESSPLKVGQPPMQPSTEEASKRECLTYAMAIGDLVWAQRTDPTITSAVHQLAQFVKNPGSQHQAGLRRLLGYLRGRIGCGLVFHGSNTVLSQAYEHRHVLIGACDSDFKHDGKKADAGAVIFMNGAAIFHRSHRLNTISLHSTDAEVKASAVIAEVIQAIVPLWEEFFSRRHPTVRVLIDNKGARKQISDGIDTTSSAPYARCKNYSEEKASTGLLWWDLVPGEENPADILTKQVRDLTEFTKKCGVVSGSSPEVYMSAEVIRILSDNGSRSTRPAAALMCNPAVAGCQPR